MELDSRPVDPTMTARIGLALELGLDFERHAAVTFNRGDRDTGQPRFVPCFASISGEDWDHNQSPEEDY